MPTFYYLAVSNADNRKLTGQIDADTEIDAKVELNKMGLAILSIGKEKFAEEKSSSNSFRSFEFEAIDLSKKPVDGTIEAYDREAAYDRLTTEFHFDVKYVCLVGASPTERKKAREDGVESILRTKMLREEAAEEAHKKTLKGSLEELVKKAEDTFKTATPESGAPVVKPKPETSKGQDSADAAPTKKDDTKSTNKKSSQPVRAALPDEATEDAQNPLHMLSAASGKQSNKSSWTNWQFTNLAAVKYWQESRLGKFTKQVLNKFKSPPVDDVEFSILPPPIKPKPLHPERAKDPTFFALFRPVLLPPAGQTRAQAYAAFRLAWSARQQKAKTERQLASMLRRVHRAEAIARFWDIAAHFFGVLAFLYFTYFALASFALQYQWGAISQLAALTVGHSTLIPYLAFSFIFIRLLIAIRAHFTVRHVIATSLLFTTGVFFLFIAGINVLYS